MISRLLPTFHAAGLRLTGPRQAILAYLSAQTHPLSARVVYEAVKRSGIDRSSVFRTLQTLARLGFLTTTESPSHERLYEFQKNHHHHLQCVSCGKLKHISCFLTTARIRSLRRATGFRSIRHETDLFGLCESCGIDSSSRHHANV